MNGLKIFSGNSNIPVAEKICEHFGCPLGKAKVSRFSDGEIQLEIHENVRGSDVFVLQSTCPPGNDHLMEMLVMIDAFKRASAHRITAAMPYYGYARQDRKVAPRAPITAKLIADLLTTAGADRILTMDLHAGQIQGFFNIPVDNLFATPVFINYLKTKYSHDDLVLVSPDAGGVERARAYAQKMGTSLAIIDKRRLRPNESEVMHIIGDIRGKHALLLDDLIDTAGTITSAAASILERGARSVSACATHAVLSGPALERIENSCLDELIVADTIPVKDGICSKITVLSIADLFAEAIKRIHTNDSVSSLFI